MYWMVEPYLWLGIPTILLFVAVSVWTIANQVPTRIISFVGPVVMFAAHMVATVIVARRSLLVRRELRAADGLLCIGCGYPLPYEEPAGNCPECGREYEADATRKGWRSLIPYDTERPKRRSKPSRNRGRVVGAQKQETPP